MILDCVSHCRGVTIAAAEAAVEGETIAVAIKVLQDLLRTRVDAEGPPHTLAESIIGDAMFSNAFYPCHAQVRHCSSRKRDCHFTIGCFACMELDWKCICNYLTIGL
jgi:hypothetical protein